MEPIDRKRSYVKKLNNKGTNEVLDSKKSVEKFSKSKGGKQSPVLNSRRSLSLRVTRESQVPKYNANSLKSRSPTLKRRSRVDNSSQDPRRSPKLSSKDSRQIQQRSKSADPVSLNFTRINSFKHRDLSGVSRRPISRSPELTVQNSSSSSLSKQLARTRSLTRERSRLSVKNPNELPTSLRPGGTSPPNWTSHAKRVIDKDCIQSHSGVVVDSVFRRPSHLSSSPSTDYYRRGDAWFTRSLRDHNKFMTRHPLSTESLNRSIRSSNVSLSASLRRKFLSDVVSPKTPEFVSTSSYRKVSGSVSQSRIGELSRAAMATPKNNNKSILKFSPRNFLSRTLSPKVIHRSFPTSDESSSKSPRVGFISAKTETAEPPSKTKPPILPSSALVASLTALKKDNLSTKNSPRQSLRSAFRSMSLRRPKDGDKVVVKDNESPNISNTTAKSSAEVLPTYQFGSPLPESLVPSWPKATRDSQYIREVIIRSCLGFQYLGPSFEMTLDCLPLDAPSVLLCVVFEANWPAARPAQALS